MKQSLLVMGANPAWQSTLFFAGLEKNRVNRASLLTNYPAGKGVNFCRAARCFGEADPLLLQFAGGSTGARLCAALDREGIRHETVETEAETRCCITCLDSADHTMTELIEPSHPVTPGEAAQFLARLSAMSLATCNRNACFTSAALASPSLARLVTSRISLVPR